LATAADTKPATRTDKPVAVADKDSKEREAAFQKAFVTINGQPQSVGMAELLLRDQLLRGAFDGPELRNAVREALVANALMEQEARQAGLDKNPLVQAQMELARQRVLINAWQRKTLGDELIGDAEIQAEYNKQIERMSAADVRIRQILVADEVSAKLLLDKVKSGGKMDELAREYSREPGAKASGGLSDWINQADLLPALADATNGVGKGKLVDKPVQTLNGWHVIQIDDTRPFNALALDEIKPQIQLLLQQRALQGKIKVLREKAKVQ
jgi:peptidyl-prolyl cis-trans isomerase C